MRPIEDGDLDAAERGDVGVYARVVLPERPTGAVRARGVIHYRAPSPDAEELLVSVTLRAGDVRVGLEPSLWPRHGALGRLVGGTGFRCLDDAGAVEVSALHVVPTPDQLDAWRSARPGEPSGDVVVEVLWSKARKLRKGALWVAAQAAGELAVPPARPPASERGGVNVRGLAGDLVKDGERGAWRRSDGEWVPNVRGLSRLLADKLAGRPFDGASPSNLRNRLAVALLVEPWTEAELAGRPE